MNCPECLGKKRIAMPSLVTGFEVATRICPACQGTGKKARLDGKELGEKVIKVLWNYVGSRLTNEEVDTITDQIIGLFPQKDEAAIRREIICPFCKRDDFDLMGLKYHLSNSCDIYQETENLPF